MAKRVSSCPDSRDNGSCGDGWMVSINAEGGLEAGGEGGEDNTGGACPVHHHAGHRHRKVRGEVEVGYRAQEGEGEEKQEEANDGESSRMENLVHHNSTDESNCGI